MRHRDVVFDLLVGIQVREAESHVAVLDDVALRPRIAHPIEIDSLVGRLNPVPELADELRRSNRQGVQARHADHVVAPWVAAALA